MKTPYVLAICVAVLCASCSDDKDPGHHHPGYFTYKGQEYPLDKGFVNITCAISDENETFWHHDVMLFPSAAQITTQCVGFQIEGSGSGLVFGLDTKSPTLLNDGTYNPADAMKPNALRLGYFTLYDFKTPTWVSKGTENGSVTILKEGDEYSIDSRSL
ncbi:MAG TPA: hypothetical protein VD927_00755 [Chryseosolibacter sp.]|nr:hypothetical protein [Chryseosolibacter sp.]